MIGRRTAVAALLAAATALGPATVFAMGPQQGTNTTEDGYQIRYERPGGYTTGGGGGSIDCTYRLLPIVASSGDGSAEADIVERQGVEEVDENGVATRADPNDPSQTMVLYFRSGADCATVGPVWVSTSLTPESLIPALRVEIVDVLPLPVPNMSPDPSVGSVVNLGLWLAIEDPGVEVPRVTDGPVWAEGSATLTGFSVDPGDGSDPVPCDSTGVPYVDGSNDPEEGPCGHTYRQPSGSGTPYQLTITSTYAVTYRLSNGVGGALGDVDRATTFDYEVTEIQTVGVGR